jgi:hypothetical protein
MYILLACLSSLQAPVQAPEATIAWEAHRLSETFFSEGAAFGDFNRDGVNDVVSGPYWYEGPEYRDRHLIYEPKPYEVASYSDNFLSWSSDIDGDGWTDYIVAGYPGREAWWFQNPGEKEQPWKRFAIHDNVENESPSFVDMDGDGLEDLVCHSRGVMCWLGRDKTDPTAPWTKHDFSLNLGLVQFTHGMGVGDLSGDGRPDVLINIGWFEQPESLEGDPVWTFHKGRFSPDYGGAQMIVYDVDADGDNDVVGSLQAHGYGLSWFESQEVEGARYFKQRKIMGAVPGEFGCPLAVSELHALALADVDGDGLQDIVTGKRYLSHYQQEPGWSDTRYLLWFKLARSGEGKVIFTPHVIDDASGVGTQIVAGDIDGDGRIDALVGNKSGTSLLLQRSVGNPGARVIPVPAVPETQKAQKQGATKGTTPR